MRRRSSPATTTRPWPDRSWKMPSNARSTSSTSRKSTRSPRREVARIKRLSEYIGQSYFDYLAGLDDLVLLMDESHRYRASAGVRAINELKPVLGLELTATPFVETSKGAVPFKNVIIDYPLGQAMADGFVKEPAVVTRKDFNPAGMYGRGDRAVEAGRRRPPARERQGRPGDLRPRDGQRRSSSRSSWSLPATRRTPANCCN